jgi:hypothetical protein
VGRGLGFGGQGRSEGCGSAVLAQDFLPEEGDDPIGGTGRQRERRAASVPLRVCPGMGRGLLLRPGRKLSPDPLFFF